ncbi:MAG: glycosyltransferase family 4 protein [Candidatus Korarchaeum sp.]
MRICMVLLGYFPPDIRIEREAGALLEAGHEVYLLSLGRRGTPREEVINGIRVIRTPPSEGFLSNLLWFSMFLESPLYRRELERLIRQHEIEVIHVHDLPLVKTAVSVAKKFNIPVVADLHENYPEMVRESGRKGLNWRGRIFDSLVLPIWRWKRLERAVLQRVSRVITVSDEMREHYVNDCGVPPEKVTVIMNTEDLKLFDSIEIDEPLVERYRDYYVISYIGGFDPLRGIDIAIKSMPKVLERIAKAKLLLVGGKGPSGFEGELRRLCKELKVESSVEFTGWVDFSLVPSYIAASDICLVPYHPGGNTDIGIPHKLFQYMAMGKPVIVTDRRALRRIVEECNCGIVVPPDHDKMAEAIIELYEDPEYARRLGENGRRAVEEKYNWERDARKLRDLYASLGSS